MITPTKKLLEAIEIFADRRTFCERVGMDESFLSRLLARERSAPAPTMEKVCRFFGMPLSEAWEIRDGEMSNED